jgi:hypothetical protein
MGGLLSRYQYGMCRPGGCKPVKREGVLQQWFALTDDDVRAIQALAEAA